MLRARAAQPMWEALGVAERARRLRPLARLLADRRDAIADLIEEENGKPRTEAMLHDVVASAQFVAWACDAAPRVLAPHLVNPAWFVHRRARIHRRPFGVVGAIGPWNIPLYIPVSMCLPALLAGNVVVFKPSERTPRIGHLLGGMIRELDIPLGVMQVIEGGPELGAALVQEAPDKLLFTGSAATGRKVMAACAAHPIPCALELGGVDAMIVRADADIALAASAAVWGATFNGGQACCSIERILVHRSVHDALVSRMAERMGRIDLTRDLAPAIDDRQHALWIEHVADARERGLTLVHGGGDAGGRRMVPTLIAGEGVRASRCWREETFGPVVAVCPFDTDEEAIRMQNATEYGLTASIYTRDVPQGRAMAIRLRAGAVTINELGAMVYATPELPWGGVGASGFGRSHGEEGLLDATWAQVIDEARLPGLEPRRPWWYPYDRSQAEALGRLADAVDAGALAGAAAVADTGRRVLRLLTRTPRS
jgi:succinate-semialdehyde dehydrogenase/glutarate-semialdehyde dehydrogenase